MLPWKPVHHRRKKEIPKENYYTSQAFPSPPKSATIYSDSRDSTPPTLLQFWAFALIWNTQKRAQKEVQTSLTATAEILLLGGKCGIQGIAATPTNNPKDRSCTNTPKTLMFATHRTDVVSTQRKYGAAQRSRGNLIMSLEPSAPEFPHFGKGAWTPGTNSQEMHRVLTIEIFIQAPFALQGWMRPLRCDLEANLLWKSILVLLAQWSVWSLPPKTNATGDGWTTQFPQPFPKSEALLSLIIFGSSPAVPCPVSLHTTLTRQNWEEQRKNEKTKTKFKSRTFFLLGVTRQWYTLVLSLSQLRSQRDN